MQGQKLAGTLGDACKLRLSEYIDHWLQNTARRTLRQTTYDSYQTISRLHISPYIGGIRRANCPEVRFHDLRHTYATLALANGVPVRVVADTLGHSRTSVTMDVYAHVLPAQERSAADAMDAAFE